MDRFTIRSLELIAPMNEDGSSLLNVIDNTITPMGWTYVTPLDGLPTEGWKSLLMSVLDVV